MTYDKIDWDAEAKRLAKAFGIEGECDFREHIRPKGSKRLRMVGAKSNDINFVPDNQLRVVYDTNGRYFYMAGKPRDNWLSLKIGWGKDDIAFTSGGDCSEISLSFAKALFNLGFLTPKVEAKLPAIISNHQKLEWTLESK